MTKVRTLIQMAGINPALPRLADAAIVVIDAQNEYVNGKLALPDVDVRLKEIETLLARGRAAGTPVLHVKHVGRPGGLFDPDASGGQIAASVSPLAGEAVIEKRLPNTFAGTDLDARLVSARRKNLVVAGFMTHLCVSSTVRAALDHGYACTIVAGATGTRDLPAASGESVIPAQVIHEATLASLADRFAVVVRTAADLPD